MFLWQKWGMIQCNFFVTEMGNDSMLFFQFYLIKYVFLSLYVHLLIIRIGMAKDAFGNWRELLARTISRAFKNKIGKTYIWSVAFYGCETWRLRKEDTKRLEAMEMLIWRRMKRMSWAYKKTNEEVLKTLEKSEIW